MKPTNVFGLIIVCFAIGLGNFSALAFYFRWPFSFYPGLTGATTGTAAGTINYGFLRPSIIVPVPTTTTAATTTTTTQSPAQILLNTLLANYNNSLFLSLAGSLAGRPVIGGIAQPFPGIVGPGGIPPPVVGGIAQPFPGGLVGPGGIQTSVAGGVAFPGVGGLAGVGGGGGLIASGLLPGLLPGIIGRTAAGGTATSKTGGGKVVFPAKKRK